MQRNELETRSCVPLAACQCQGQLGINELRQTCLLLHSHSLSPGVWKFCYYCFGLTSLPCYPPSNYGYNSEGPGKTPKSSPFPFPALLGKVKVN